MIARFSFSTEAPFHLLVGQTYRPFEIERENYTIRFHPPQTSKLQRAPKRDEVPLIERPRLLVSTDPLVRPELKVDDTQVIEASLIQIDFIRDDFERLQSSDDPPIKFVFEILNSYLRGVRVLSKTPNLKPAVIESIWQIQYLQDNEQPLQQQEGKIRGRFGTSFQVEVRGITPELWGQLPNLLPDAKATPWEVLFLDAHSLLPDIGPALTLTAISLEVLISDVVEHVAKRSKCPPEIWNWITDRGDWRLEPSVTEKFDTLLKALCGSSLKEDRPDLWEAFKNLRSVRNSFAHEGQVVFGKDKAVVTADFAATLMAKAAEIIDWFDPLIPPEWRRQKLSKSIQTSIDIRFA